MHRFSDSLRLLFKLLLKINLSVFLQEEIEHETRRVETECNFKPPTATSSLPIGSPSHHAVSPLVPRHPGIWHRNCTLLLQ